MKIISSIALIATLIFSISCNSKKEIKQEQEISFNQELADELAQMGTIDQIAAYIPKGKYKAYSQNEWQAFKDSVFTNNKRRANEIFKQHGFPGYDLVGKDGERDFWLIVQHSDFDPDFQKEVLKAMKPKVENNNAKSSHYALLTDRVNLNTGNKQIYGTQVAYDLQTGQVYPKPLKDSARVNKRRKSVGLEPLEIYLNNMSQMHFEMNKENYIKKGINEPYLYKLPSDN
ncbi:hypothetical protein GCM10027429_26240 [Marivirga atlantica]|jgi:hypothetical protein|uniref:Lipoprotein n=1 Tax=Marivirga atlantica TaxID=1548457 RepID=A0A937AIM4_9BACT|nr:DUF6624 domain-containing protein [Marivirga atlantica]MBL0766224.1 hypothetical protein [Marivirga atlantica]